MVAATAKMSVPYRSILIAMALVRLWAVIVAIVLGLLITEMVIVARK